MVIDEYVQQMISHTCGRLYKPVVGRLTRYPIPVLRLPPGNGRRLLDIGSGWGRWTLSAARAGYHPVGIDYNWKAVAAAKRVAQQLGISAHYVVGSVTALPFREDFFDAAFSYSVIQHQSKEDARAALREASRVVREGGRVVIQMPNKFGGLEAVNRFRYRKSRNPRRVRYWGPRELLSTFRTLLGPSRLEVDGFFCLDPQPTDLDLLPVPQAMVVRVSEVMRRLATVVRPLKYVADSLYVYSTNAKGEVSLRESR